METELENRLKKSLGDINVLLHLDDYNDKLYEILENIDLLSYIQLAESVCVDLEINADKSPPFITSCIHLCETLEKIYKLLSLITNELANHETRYFYYWRTPQYEQQVLELKRQRRILSKRIKHLIAFS